MTERNDWESPSQSWGEHGVFYLFFSLFLGIGQSIGGSWRY